MTRHHAVALVVAAMFAGGCGEGTDSASDRETEPRDRVEREATTEKAAPADDSECRTPSAAAREAFAEAFPDHQVRRIRAARAQGDLDLPPAPAWEDGAYFVSGELVDSGRVATLFVSGDWIERGGGFAAGFGPLKGETELGADLPDAPFGASEADPGYTQALICARG